MFNTCISDTALTTQFADSCFTNIKGDSFNGDVSFVATLRALLPERFEKYKPDDMGAYDDAQCITVINDYTTVNKNQLESSTNPIGLIIRDSRLTPANTITVLNVATYGKENIDAVFDKLNAEFTQTHPDWVRIEKLTVFFQKSFAVTCFVNKYLRSTLIAVESLDLRRYHYLQGTTFAFLPWYFSVEDGLSDQERRLIQSFLQPNSQDYLDCIAEYASKYDFREAGIRNMLKGFELRYERARLTTLENEIQNIINQIQRLNDDIANKLRTKRDRETEMLGLGLKIDTGASQDSEIMNYFIANKKLVLEEVTETNVVFGVKDYLTYYDEDQVRATLTREGGYVDSCRSGSITADGMRSLVTAIFLDQKLKLRVCAKYSLELRGNVSGLSHETYPESEYGGYMPNTHIDEFACMGNYSQTINTLLQRNEYVGAIEQCVASCKSLNFMDYTVMRKFMSSLYSSRTRCIELPDGSVVKPKEAIEYLKSCENNESEEQNG